LVKFGNLEVMKRVVSLLFVFVFLFGTVTVSSVFAQDVDTSVDQDVVEVKVDPADVPEPGGFADWFQNITEKIQIFVTRDEEKRIELEEKFAARREAQMQRLEALLDDHPRKERLIKRIEERHERLISRLEKRAQRVGNKKERFLKRLEDRKERLRKYKDRALRREHDEDLKDEGDYTLDSKSN